MAPPPPIPLAALVRRTLETPRALLARLVAATRPPHPRIVKR